MAAVEFALVCGPAVIFLLAVMGAGVHYYVQHALDYATQASARQVQLGHVPSNYTQTDFINKVLCPLFSPFQVCANLFVDLRPVTDFQQLTNPGVPDAPDSTETIGFVFCPGKPGQLMYAHIVYVAPLIGGNLFGGGFGGTNAIVANAAFANENPTGVPVANGC